MNAKHGAMTALMVVVCAGGLSPAQDSTLVYRADFERHWEFGNEWSDRGTSINNNFSTFLGRFGRETVSLRLNAPDLPDPGGPDNPDGPDGPDGPGGPDVPGGRIIKSFGRPISVRPAASSPYTFRLTFDLYLIDSWDGAEQQYGQDRMIVDINGQTLFDEALTTHSNHANFREADQWGTNLGYSHWNDMIFRDVQIEFTLEPGTELIEIDFFGSLNQPMGDESWGLDNVRLEYFRSVIPTPGTLGVGVGGLALLSRRRR